jgi:predicted TIM-barrel fold metal-dependent hydrolase
MTPDYPIIDCHAHIFPALRGASGFPSAADHLLHQQRAMHVHGNQPYRRASDHSVVNTRDLWDPEDHSAAGRAHDSQFRVGRNGRFEWKAHGEDVYCQFLPPYMHDMSAPPDAMVVDMDYSGIGTVVLQNDHIYGDLAPYFAQAMQTFPGRFIGLAQVDEPFGYRDEQLAKLEREVTQSGMRGLYFTMTGFFRDGYRHFPDEPLFDPLWQLVARHALPVFWVHSAKSAAGSYIDEMQRLRRIVERHPDIRHVLVHGVPTSIYCDADDHIEFPPEVADLLDHCPVFSELLYPIAWGGKMDYPYTRAHGHIRQVYDRFGPDKLTWGSDMPNVGRYCTYRQALTYVWDYCDFLTPTDRRKIFHGNSLSLFATPTQRDDHG